MFAGKAPDLDRERDEAMTNLSSIDARHDRVPTVEGRRSFDLRVAESAGTDPQALAHKSCIGADKCFAVSNWPACLERHAKPDENDY